VECFETLLQWRPSPGTISNILESAGKNAAPSAEMIKGQIHGSEYIHLDGYNLSLGGQKYWLWNASTESQTYLYLHPNRSREALAQFGIL
jgi:hypothetical protein